MGKVKVSGLRINYNKAHKEMLKDAVFKAYLKKVAKHAEGVLKSAIEDNDSSRDQKRTKKQVEYTKKYFSDNVHGSVIKGKKRIMVRVGSYGNNSAAYEAEHNDMPQAVHRMKQEGKKIK